MEVCYCPVRGNLKLGIFYKPEFEELLPTHTQITLGFPLFKEKECDTIGNLAEVWRILRLSVGQVKAKQRIA
jgi:hypothetical protein